MTPQGQHIENLENRVNTLFDATNQKINSIDTQRNRLTQDMKVLTDAKVARIQTRLERVILESYMVTSVKVGNIIVHHSPGLLATLSAIWGTLQTIYKAVQWFVTTFKIAEIVKLIDLARTISPKFRAWTNQMLKGLRDFATDIGLGADAFYNALHAVQGTLTATAGMLGKDWDWVESQYVEKTMQLSKRLSYWGKQVQDNPGEFIEDVFYQEKGRELQLQGTTWGKIWEGIEKGVNWADKALDDTKQLTNSLQELENALPKKIRKHIPEAVWDTVSEVDTMINDIIEPRFEKLNEAVDIVSSAVNTQKDKISGIVDRLSLPGDYLEEIDKLDAQLKQLQEKKLDELTAREIERQADEQNAETADIFESMQRIEEAGISPGEMPSFLGLEPKSNPRPPGAEGEQYETWFVGDY